MSLNTPLMGTEQKLVHVDDSGNASEVSANVSGTGASFTAESFSIYVLVGNGEEYKGDYKNRTFDYAIDAGEALTLAEDVQNGKNEYLGGTWAIKEQKASSAKVSQGENGENTEQKEVIAFGKGAVLEPETSAEQKTVAIKTTGAAGEATVTYTYKAKGAEDTEEKEYTDTYTIHIKGYTAHFNANGGTGTVEDVSVSRAANGYATIQLPDGSGLSRDGYKLIGWTLTSDAMTDGRRNGWYDAIYDLDDGNAATTKDTYSWAKGDAEEITFYAAWAQTSSKSGKIGFFVRDDGTIQTEPASYSSSYYTTITPGGEYYKSVSNLCDYITMIKTETDYKTKVPANITAKAWNEVYQELKHPSNDTVRKFIKKHPGLLDDEDISKGQEYIAWYVIKDQGSWHVDGVLRSSSSGSGDGATAKYNLDYVPNCNGITGQAPVSRQYDAGTEVTIEGRNTLERVGYTFGGWNTEPDGSGIGYQEGKKITMTEDVTLYAQWLPNSDTKYTLIAMDSESDEEISNARKVRTGVTGNTIEAIDSDKVLEGYDFDEDNPKNVTEATIAPDGSTTLILYFKKGHSINITMGSVSKPYDGKEVPVAIESVTFDKENAKYILDGNTLTVTSGEKTYTVTGLTFATNNEKGEPVSAKDVGKYVMAAGDPTKATVTDSNDKERKAITVKADNGEIEIYKRQMTITSGSNTWKYDGTAHKEESVTETGDGWLDKDKPEYAYLNSQKLQGTSQNVFILKKDSIKTEKVTDWEAEFPNYDIEVIYGTLTVEAEEGSIPITISVKTDSSTYTYDGEEHSIDKAAFTISGSGATEVDTKLSAFEKFGEFFTRKVTKRFQIGEETYTLTGITAVGGKGTDAGEYPITFSQDDKAKIVDSDGNDVSKLFSVKTESNAKLTITKAEVTLKSGSLNKDYDGDPLVNGDTALKVNDGWVGDEGKDVKYSFTSSITEPGSIPNEFTIESYPSGTNPNNYEIVYAFGNLEINSKNGTLTLSPITPNGTPNGKELLYDGEKKSVSGFVGQGEDGRILVTASNGKEYYLSNVSAWAEGTDAGTYPVSVTTKGYQVWTKNGKEVTSEFATPQVNDANLVIRKRTVTFTSGSKEWKYDKKPHKLEGVTVGGDGLTEDDAKAFSDKDYAEIIFVDPFWENGTIQLLCTALEILFTKNPDATREDFFELFSKDENTFIDYIMEGKATDFKALLFATNPLSAITSIYHAIRTAFTSATIEEAKSFS